MIPYVSYNTMMDKKVKRAVKIFINYQKKIQNKVKWRIYQSSFYTITKSIYFYYFLITGTTFLTQLDKNMFCSYVCEFSVDVFDPLCFTGPSHGTPNMIPKCHIHTKNLV